MTAARREMAGVAAIAGFGMSEVGRVHGLDATGFATVAVDRAIADAGLGRADVDGLLMSWGVSGKGRGSLAHALGLRDLRMEVTLDAFGASSGAAVQLAAMAVASGTAERVVCVHADAPLATPTTSAADVYGGTGRPGPPRGFRSIRIASGFAGANPAYALAARRHMAAYGTTEDHLAAVAVSQRSWAAMSPLATMRDPITVEDHHASRWVAEPLRLLDCCLVSNGAVAVIVTSAEEARRLAQPPVYVWGWGQGHPVHSMARGSEFGLRSGAALSGSVAFDMAGIGPRDVDVAELYDCYTYTVVLTLEDYGFCPKGEGGPFAASGALGPGGSLPTNTGGGQLSGYYLWGATPLSEAVLQVRGQAGDRQVARHDIALVSGNGGILDHHATLILAGHPR